MTIIDVANSIETIVAQHQDFLCSLVLQLGKCALEARMDPALLGSYAFFSHPIQTPTKSTRVQKGVPHIHATRQYSPLKTFGIVTFRMSQNKIRLVHRLPLIFFFAKQKTKLSSFILFIVLGSM